MILGIFDFPCRALLQLSALCQRTHDCSNVLTTLLTQLDNILLQFNHVTGSHTHHTYNQDHTLLQWLVLLLSHIVSSLTVKTAGKNQPNLFQPSSLLPSDSSADCLEQDVGIIVSDSEFSDRRDILKQKLVKLRHEIRHAIGDEKADLIKEFETMRQVSYL